MNYEKYQPVLMNHKAELADAMQRDGFKEAWDELNEEYDILKIIIKSQKSSESMQEEITHCMETTHNV